MSLFFCLLTLAPAVRANIPDIQRRLFQNEQTKDYVYIVDRKGDEALLHGAHSVFIGVPGNFKAYTVAEARTYSDSIATKEVIKLTNDDSIIIIHWKNGGLAPRYEFLEHSDASHVRFFLNPLDASEIASWGKDLGVDDIAQMDELITNPPARSSATLEIYKVSGTENFLILAEETFISNKVKNFRVLFGSNEQNLREKRLSNPQTEKTTDTHTEYTLSFADGTTLTIKVQHPEIMPERPHQLTLSSRTGESLKLVWAPTEASRVFGSLGKLYCLHTLLGPANPK